MRLVSTAELKNHTNEVLRAALAGDPVVVTRHGRPVASLLRLEERDMAALATDASRAARRPEARRAQVTGGLGPYWYAGFPQAFGSFFVACGPAGPVFTRVAPSASAFEREASRYLGAPVRRAPAPAWLAAAVEAAIRRGDAFRGPVDLTRVGPFEAEVLARLRRIPAGQVRTYREIARAVGQPGAARAVGAACARNPLPLLIPCHRVVRTDGGLGGYSLRGGVALKRRLLEAEGALPTLLR
jgi:methylated-DNA-[protein]-cysteine S-methyltransferase